MSLVAETALEPGLLEPKTLLQRQIGAASPLWALYAGAALTGATWWWLSRWGRPENLEALFGARDVAPSAETPALLARPEPLADPVEAPPEAAVSGVTIPSEVATPLEDPATLVAESVETIVEAIEAAPAIMAQAAESVIEASVEATEAVVLAAAEAMDGPLEDPVGGESAPIAPTVAVAPRTRRKPTEPTAD